VSEVRITAQLINVDDGFHLWSETYDRELTDIFAIQDEITNAIVNALKVHLSGSQTSALKPSWTTSPDAYAIYLQARQKLALRGDHMVEARRLFEEVIRKDPDYAPAYSGLGRTLSVGRNWTTEITYHDATAVAKEAANKALKLDPENAEAYSVLGSIASYSEWDWEAAEQAHLKSIKINPNDPEIYNFIGDYYIIISHFELAQEMKLKAIELDPLHAVNYQDK